MTYSYIDPYMNGGVALHYRMRVACSKCGRNLGFDWDVEGVKFCPSCGHELHKIPLNLSPRKIVEILNKSELVK